MQCWPVILGYTGEPQLGGRTMYCCIQHGTATATGTCLCSHPWGRVSLTPTSTVQLGRGLALLLTALV